MFRKKGAHRRFKDFLEDHGQLENWYAFEAGEAEKALRSWCDEQGIVLVDEPPPV